MWTFNCESEVSLKNATTSTNTNTSSYSSGEIIVPHSYSYSSYFCDTMPPSWIQFLEPIFEFICSIYIPALQIYGALWISWIFSRYSYIKISYLKSLIECLIVNWTVTLALPILAIAFPIFYTLRFTLDRFLKWKTHKKKFLMCGSDAVWGTESYANACNFTSLYVLQGECDLKKIRTKVLDGIVEATINGEKIYNKLKWRASSWYGIAIWERMDKSFDIKHHVKLLNGNESKVYTEDQVFDEISKFFDHPLKNTKPQWEVLVVPKYVYKDQEKNKGCNHYALIFRIHHSIMDGVSAGFALQNAIADSPPKLAVNPLAPLNIPLWKRLVSYLAIYMFGLHDALKSSMLRESNCFHGPKLTGPKKLGWSRPVDLQSLKTMKNATKTSTTAVLLSAVGTSLRNLAIKKNLKVPKVIHSSLTVAILPYPDMKPQNRFTVAHLPMKLSLGSTIERIKSTYRNAQKLAWSSEPLVNFYLMRLLGESTTWICQIFNQILHATLLLSNVPGPAEEVTLFQGDKLVDVIFWTPLRNSVGISMSIFSYAGKVRVGMVADSVVFPDPSDVPILIQEFEKEIVNTGIIAGYDDESSQSQIHQVNQTSNSISIIEAVDNNDNDMNNRAESNQNLEQATEENLIQLIHPQTKIKPCLVKLTKLPNSTSASKHSEESSQLIPLTPQEYRERFRNSKNVSRHSRSNKHDHPETSTNSDKLHKKKRNNKNPFECEICGKKFRLNEYIIRHRDRIHREDKKRFKCETCGKHFNDKSKLNQHILIHTRIKPYKCSICKKRFNNRQNMKFHRQKHSGFKRYSCIFCGKKFNSSTYFHKHLHIHTEKKRISQKFYYYKTYS